MLSIRIRKVLAMTMAIAVMESFIGIKPIITSAYAEEKESNEILFNDAQEKLIEKLDEEITKGSSEEDAIGILEKFDYSYNVTSGEAVTIGAGNISELKNDESGCYFNAKLYNNLTSESYNFNYSNLYSSIMLMRNANSEFCLDKGNIVIEENPIGYYDDSGNLINKPIDSSVSLFITQNDDSETSNTITVKSGTHTIVLNGINIKDCNGPAIDIQEDSKVTLELNRENNISITRGEWMLSQILFQQSM